MSSRSQFYECRTLPEFNEKFDSDIPNWEAERSVLLDIYCTRSSGITTIHQVECGVDILIAGLKQDLQTILDMEPEKQIWSLRGRQLCDTKSLSDYGIQGNEHFSRNSIKIFVEYNHYSKA
ncbi:hypothetical protein BgiMline_035803 [Biomphalaria glabrata]|nr:hypothetical protein BgiMline_031101 [Biomphalaria glabrata]